MVLHVLPMFPQNSNSFSESGISLPLEDSGMVERKVDCIAALRLDVARFQPYTQSQKSHSCSVELNFLTSKRNS